MPGRASSRGDDGRTCVGNDGSWMREQPHPLSAPPRVVEPRCGTGESDLSVGSMERRAAEFIPRRRDEIAALLSAFRSRYREFERYLASPAANVTPTDLAVARATGHPQGLTAKNIARVDVIEYLLAMMNGFNVRLAQIQGSLGRDASDGGAGLIASRELVAGGLADLNGAIAQWTEELKVCQEALDSLEQAEKHHQSRVPSGGPGTAPAPVI